MTDHRLLLPPPMPPLAIRRRRVPSAGGLPHAARLAYGLAVLALPALGITVADKVRPGGAVAAPQAAVPSLPPARTAAAPSPDVGAARIRRASLALAGK